jgi:predicted ester cyclase
MRSIYIVPGIAMLLAASGPALGQVTPVSKTTAQPNEQVMPGTENIKNKEAKMKRNKETIKAIFEQSFNKRNMELLGDLVDPEYVAPNGEHGPAGFKKTFGGLIKVMPDIQWNLKDLAADSDKVFARWEVNGTNTGQFQHFPATGKKVTGTGMGIFTFRDGKVISSIVQTDRLGFLQQIGVLPLDLSALSNGAKEPNNKE